MKTDPASGNAAQQLQLPDLPPLVRVARAPREMHEIGYSRASTPSYSPPPPLPSSPWINSLTGQHVNEAHKQSAQNMLAAGAGPEVAAKYIESMYGPIGKDNHDQWFGKR